MRSPRREISTAIIYSTQRGPTCCAAWDPSQKRRSVIGEHWNWQLLQAREDFWSGDCERFRRRVAEMDPPDRRGVFVFAFTPIHGYNAKPIRVSKDPTL